VNPETGGTRSGKRVRGGGIRYQELATRLRAVGERATDGRVRRIPSGRAVEEKEEDEEEQNASRQRGVGGGGAKGKEVARVREAGASQTPRVPISRGKSQSSNLISGFLVRCVFISVCLCVFSYVQPSVSPCTQPTTNTASLTFLRSYCLLPCACGITRGSA
jgi:hypothetical protein